jgi:hypothetical protein
MKMIPKVLALVLMFLFIISPITAITAKIGNAKAIVNADVGDELRRTVLVRNTNDVDVIINIFASGDLEEYITIIDNNFTLRPDEFKKARYEVEVKKGGTTTTNINVQFTPTDEGNGVGLSAELIIKTDGQEDEEDYEESNEEDKANNDSNTGVTIGFNNPVTGNVVGSGNVSNEVVFGILSTLVILLVFVGLLIYMRKNNKRGIKRGKINGRKKV